MWESVRRKLENVGEVLNGAHDHMSVAQQHRLKGRPLNQPRITEMLAPRGGVAAGGNGGGGAKASSSGREGVTRGDGGKGPGGNEEGENGEIRASANGGGGVENLGERQGASLGANGGGNRGDNGVSTAEGIGALGPDVNAGRRVSADAAALFSETSSTGRISTEKNSRGSGANASGVSKPGPVQREGPGSQPSVAAMFRQSLGGDVSGRGGTDVSEGARPSQSGSRNFDPKPSGTGKDGAGQSEAVGGGAPSGSIEEGRKHPGSEGGVGSTQGSVGAQASGSGVLRMGDGMVGGAGPSARSRERASEADTQGSIGAQRSGSGVLRTGTGRVEGTVPTASIEGRSSKPASEGNTQGSVGARASRSGMLRMGTGLEQCSEESSGRLAGTERAERAEPAERVERTERAERAEGAEGRLRQCPGETVGVPLHEELRRDYKEVANAMAGAQRLEAKRRREEGEKEDVSKLQKLH